MRIGIMSAVPEENGLKLQTARQERCAQRIYTIGFCGENEVILAFSRWGKVAAAMTATHLINNFHVDVIIFTGVAGTCSNSVRVGDIVIAESLIQHDMDARPIFARHEIPLIGVTSFQMDREWTNRAQSAAIAFLGTMEEQELKKFNIDSPKVFLGEIASGDKFFASQKDLHELQSRLPLTLCVEMEGAAVAQVCYEHQIPCAIIRTISDSGSENSPEQFQQFLSSIASRYSKGILESMFKSLPVTRGVTGSKPASGDE